MKKLQITPARSILANSSDEVLRQMPGCGGVFQVVWMAEIDARALLFERGGSVQILATHHNGHSCHALAVRMIAGDSGRSVDQLDYIRDCGGTVISSESVVSIIKNKKL